MLIGLTGQIGAGKSTVAEMLTKRGAHIIEADQIGREVVVSSKTVLNRLAREYGKDILDESGILNRSELARRAFVDDDTKALLDSIVQPYLLKELNRRVAAAKEKHSYIIIDAALLLDWDIINKCDFVIVVEAPREQRLAQLEGRGISRSDAKKRMKRLPTVREFNKAADFIIINDSTKDALGRKVRSVWKQITDEKH
ncbi:MAG: dephospho-CoA kinase [candidate division Zixibacteria bacterium]|nr:dephospho-CoA kinase [candidate division Zixibacteria bacterium]